jgi:hypothetical protein
MAPAQLPRNLPRDQCNSDHIGNRDRGMQMNVGGFELNRSCFALSGLLTAAALVLFSTPGSSAQLTQYYVPRIAAVTLRFSALDPVRAPIDERWLLAELTAALRAQSGWQLKSTGEVTAELSGLRTRLDQGQSRIVFEYVHVARSKTGYEWGQTLTIPVSYRIERGNEVITIGLWPPQMAEFATRRTPGVFFVPTPKLRPIAEVFDDFTALMRGASAVKLHHSFILGGTEESGVSPETCISNFDRLLGRYGYAKDEERVFDPKHDDVFLYRTAQDSVPLKVTAVPYRGGSKVFYEASLPFELRADGTVTGYDLPLALMYEVRQVLENRTALQLDGALNAIHK